MKVFVSHVNSRIQIQARAEGGGALGDLVLVLIPGKSFLGHPYEWWAALDDGEHDVS